MSSTQMGWHSWHNFANGRIVLTIKVCVVESVYLVLCKVILFLLFSNPNLNSSDFFAVCLRENTVNQILLQHCS